MGFMVTPGPSKVLELSWVCTTAGLGAVGGLGAVRGLGAGGGLGAGRAWRKAGDSGAVVGCMGAWGAGVVILLAVEGARDAFVGALGVVVWVMAGRWVVLDTLASRAGAGRGEGAGAPGASAPGAGAGPPSAGTGAGRRADLAAGGAGLPSSIRGRRAPWGEGCTPWEVGRAPWGELV